MKRKSRKINIIQVSERSVVLAPYIILFVILLLLIGGSVDFPVALSIAVGGSMYPTVHSGDLAVLVSTSATGLHKGDIAVYKTGSLYVLHRVVDIKNDTVIFEGDNNVYMDNPVHVSDVKYKVVFIVPYKIWVPLAAVLVVSLGIAPQYYLYKKRGEIAYTLHTYMIFLIFMLLISLFSASVFVDKGYSVKPNPMPIIEKVSPGIGGKYYVKMNIHPEKVYCKGGMCVLSGDSLIVKPKGDTVWVYVTLPTAYNLTVEFTLHFTGGGNK